MLLLQKLAGIDMLQDVYDVLDDDVEIADDRDWFKGLHRYESREDIMALFVEGRPISCFRSKSCEHTFHVAFFGQSFRNISYVTLKSRTSEMYKQESGLHFCEFRFVKEVDSDQAAVVTIEKEKLTDLVGQNALMLPYRRRNHDFWSQFTVCYSDWQVLRCNNNGTSSKGFPAPDKGVFTPELIANLRLPQS